LNFLIETANEFYSNFKPGERINFYEAYKHVFFDIITKIVFGEKVFQNTSEVLYKNPFD